MLVLTALTLTGPARAQSGNGWFVPEQAKPSAGAPPPGRGPAAGPRGTAPEQRAPVAAGPGPGGAIPPLEPPGQLPPPQGQLPPMPENPPMPKGSPTPAAIVGILSVPDILRVSTAYQMADKELGVRRGRVEEDGKKEQNTLRELGQNFANERAKLTPEQIRAREKEYAERVN